MSQSFVQTSKTRIVEFIKYDYNHLKFPCVFFAYIAIFILRIADKHEKAFSIASNVFRTGWAGGFRLGKTNASYYFIEHKELGKRLSDNFVNSQLPLPNTQKFFDDPIEMLNGIITVLQNPSEKQKGALIINYSYYFPLLIRFFNIDKIAEKFHIILEPSWAGFCEENILSYTQFSFPIFLQTYENRDLKFINSLSSNIVPVAVGPSWFINHDNYAQPKNDNPRDIDVIMVAAWAAFKRHSAFFKSLSPILDVHPNIKIVLVGYPVDLSKKDIIDAATRYGLHNNVEIHEWITPQEVASLQKRAKVNVLWSKFEGNNRAIIEGMFCGTPVIMREGHNYGENYDFINSQTGCFANEGTLPSAINKVLENATLYDPRGYVMKNRNCITATELMAKAIVDFEKATNNFDWSANLAIKVNDLHGMAYFDRNPLEYQTSYDWLITTKR